MEGVDLVQMLPISEDQLWLIVKIFFLFGLGIYLVFGLVVIKQVEMMIRALNGALELPLRLMARVHMAVAVIVFVLALIVL